MPGSAHRACQYSDIQLRDSHDKEQHLTELGVSLALQFPVRAGRLGSELLRTIEPLRA